MSSYVPGTGGDLRPDDPESWQAKYGGYVFLALLALLALWSWANGSLS
jgi:hypothetical protein